ncbi:MAG: TIGR04282 family arsenosugar biosynthesis glycosyltransferase [Acidobacteriota bacterium]|nr:TIGR04282 family arsenosugar biosynthesis glycosyltransferase [Acidobacteriota bacterium]
MKKVVVIMAKVPIVGTVKTRLRPFLSAEQSATLAECFLRDTVGKAKSLPNELIIAYTPVEKLDVLLAILSNEQIFIEQKGVNLGDKMFHAFEFAFVQNSDAVVMIGTDSPTFPAQFITQAFEMLSETDAVLGETTDGGFYLIGLQKLEKEIFEAVEWSSPKTFNQMVQNIENLGWKLSLLPNWYDVDTPDDLKRLKKDLSKNPSIAPKTFEFLESL